MCPGADHIRAAKGIDDRLRGIRTGFSRPAPHAHREREDLATAVSSAGLPRLVVREALATERQDAARAEPEGILTRAPAGRRRSLNRGARCRALAGLGRVSSRVQHLAAMGRTGSRPPLDAGPDRDGDEEIETHIGTGSRRRDELAGVADPVVVRILLEGVHHQRAIVRVVVDAIAVGVGNAVQTLVGLAVAVVVLQVADLHAPVAGDAVEGVAGVAEAVTVDVRLVLVVGQGAVVAGVAAGVGVGVGLDGVGDVAAVVDAVEHAVVVRVDAIAVRGVRVAVDVPVHEVVAHRLVVVGPLVEVSILVDDAYPALQVATEAVNQIVERGGTEVGAVAEILPVDVVGGIARDGHALGRAVHVEDADLLEAALDTRARVVRAAVVLGVAPELTGLVVGGVGAVGGVAHAERFEGGEDPGVAQGARRVVADHAQAGVGQAGTVGAAEGAVLLGRGVGAAAVGADAVVAGRDQHVALAGGGGRVVADHARARVREAGPGGAAESARLTPQLGELTGRVDAGTGEGDQLARLRIAGRGRDVVGARLVGVARGQAGAIGAAEGAGLDVGGVVLTRAVDARAVEVGHELAVARGRGRGVAVDVRHAGRGGRAEALVHQAVAVVVDIVVHLRRARVDAPGARREAHVVAAALGGELAADGRIVPDEAIAVPGAVQGALDDGLADLLVRVVLGLAADQGLDVPAGRIGGEAVAVGIRAHDPRLVVVRHHGLAGSFLADLEGPPFAAAGEEDVGEQSARHDDGAPLQLLLVGAHATSSRAHVFVDA